MILFLIAFYIIAIFLVLKTRSPLHIFVFIATTFQFLPLFLTLINKPAIFWPQDRYTISSSSNVFIALTYALSSSLAGFALSSLITLNNAPLITYYKNNGLLLSARPQLSPFLVTGTLLFGAALILANVLLETDNIFTGYQLTVSLLIATGIVFYLIRHSKPVLIASLTLLTLYIGEQIAGGDRDFATIIIALTLYLLTFSAPSKKSIFLIAFFLLVTFFLSVFISVYRQDMAVTINALLIRVYFNSWSGIIKPLIEMLIAEGIPDELLFGKTYFYAIISAPPSFIFELFGSSKPFDAHNPAWWYPRSGGGMHILGVALKNGGLVGVFLQSLALGVGSIFLERVIRKNNSFSYHLLYIAIATAILKALWYSPINLVNAFVFWAIFCVAILGTQRFLSTCLR